MELSLTTDLKSQVAVVTGASQGLGKAVAIALGMNGATVVCLARNAEKLAATVSEIESAGGVAGAGFWGSARSVPATIASRQSTAAGRV